MGRLIGSVVLGYVVIFLFIFLTFSALYLVLGVDGSFRPGSFEASGLWIGLSTPLAFAGAVIGGRVCSVVARDEKGVRALAGLVLVLGLLMAMPTLWAPAESPLRTGAIGSLKAIEQARQPPWIAFLYPFLGAIGVMIGARRRAEPAA